jgi:hypothetical protein
MRKFIKDYVDGCAICQETKINTHPSRAPPQPTQKEGGLPFQNITMDFIVELPESDGYDAILMVVDQETKAIVVEPCHSNINAIDTAELLIRRVFCKYGVPERIISDRGTQFTSKVMKAVYESLDIKPAYSTAYHPQSDGASERANQWLETYLRSYCNRSQSDWAGLLAHAELAHNTRQHSATKKTPFELLYGYQPRWPHHIKAETRVPLATEHLTHLVEARKEAQAAIKLAEEDMLQQQKQHGETGPGWKPGDQVWLEGKNLKTQYPSAKLGPKRYGPFEILQRVGNVAGPPLVSSDACGAARTF